MQTKDTAVDTDYTSLIDETTATFAKAIIGGEKRLRERRLDVDRDVLGLMRRVGHGIVQSALGAVAADACAEVARENPTLVVSKNSADEISSYSQGLLQR